MSEKNQKFIVTNDEAVARKLKFNGFTLLKNNNDQFVFINIPDKTAVFRALDTTKLYFTNILNI